MEWRWEVWREIEKNRIRKQARREKNTSQVCLFIHIDMPSRVDAGETETAIDVWKEGKQGGSRLPYWAIVLCRYESLKGYINYTLLHSYSGLNAHRVKKSIIELEHSSGAILFDFYSAAEVVGACAPPITFFLSSSFLYIFLLYVYTMFLCISPFWGEGRE